MRRRCAAKCRRCASSVRKARPVKAGLFDVKHSQGGMIDAEFAVQYLVLAHGATHAELLDNVGNIALLRRAEAAASAAGARRGRRGRRLPRTAPRAAPCAARRAADPGGAGDARSAARCGARVVARGVRLSAGAVGWCALALGALLAPALATWQADIPASRSTGGRRSRGQQPWRLWTRGLGASERHAPRGQRGRRARRRRARYRRAAAAASDAGLGRSRGR